MKPLNVKQWTILLLTTLALVCGWHYGFDKTLPQVALSLFCSVSSNAILDLISTKKLKISESAIITGLTISMVAAPKTHLAVIALMATIAIGSKYVLQINKRPVFNPAALSLLIGLFFFNVTLGWWGGYYSVLTIIAGSILLMKFSGHWKMIYAFLGTLTGLLIIRSWILNLPIIDELYLNLGISFFFVFFMLTDPKTAPILPNQLSKYAVIAAIGTVLSIQFHPPTVLIGGLLLANLLTPYINYRALKKIQTAARPTAPITPPIAPIAS